MNEIEELLQMMFTYSFRHAINGGITLHLEEDGSGALRKFDALKDEDPFFYFDTLEELQIELERI
jgi:hypothetical protein